MKQQTSLKIGIVLLILAMLVSMFLVSHSAFVAGGRKACHSIDSVLMEGFVCQQNRVVEDFTFTRMDRGDMNVTL